MPAIFEDERRVVSSEIDLMGHVNNIEYLRWTQRAAVRHSDAQGWTTEDYLRLGQGWLVRSHLIEYRQPALLGDTVVIRTWIADMKKVTSWRRFRIFRSADQALLADASTNWVFVNFQSGTLCRIPSEVRRAFEVVEEGSV